jgi:hypothetical protein
VDCIEFSFSLILLTLLRVCYQAIVHGNPRKLKTEPLGEFFHARSKLMKLETRDFHDRSMAA